MFFEGVNDGGVIEAAGGIVSRQSPCGIQIAIIHRSRYDDWTLPKGKREKNETFLEAAGREIGEEINCLVDFGPFAGCVCYEVGGVPKIVLFWHMSLVSEKPFISNREVDGLRWVSVKKAIKMLSYSGEIKLLKKYDKEHRSDKK